MHSSAPHAHLPQAVVDPSSRFVMTPLHERDVDECAEHVQCVARECGRKWCHGWRVGRSCECRLDGGQHRRVDDLKSTIQLAKGDERLDGVHLHLEV